jgi:hypothetical protein
MASVLAIGLGLIVYAWSRQLFGPIGGLISLALFATCPTMLAHGADSTPVPDAENSRLSF